jgi:tRNA G26 N,N-dimethylase Trm1
MAGYENSSGSLFVLAHNHTHADRAVLHREVPEGFSSVTEGKATILQQGNSVFYNKAQVVNRDISIAVLRWFIKQRGTGKQTRMKKMGPTGPKPVTPLQVHTCIQDHVEGDGGLSADSNGMTRYLQLLSCS